MTRTTTAPQARVEALDWAALSTELDAFGHALTPRPVLTAEECRSVAALYDDVHRFRSTIDMERYRFGRGQYRYFDHPLPALVQELRAAFYPRLPLQVVIGLDEPGGDFTGGEFLMTEQRARAQSRGYSTTLLQGHVLVFTTRDRPVRSVRGWSKGPMRHGVSTVRSGRRHTLGLVFHDAE
ncbi:2OG-Fe(II) oxygenase [Streptomyces sp. NPDC102360]|uniref:2OG-Fe(II) oxygenase n=1 Tax=Streptomyces sp. NPDC102360 TaxID=3366160 RepID=UPI00381FB35E